MLYSSQNSELVDSALQSIQEVLPALRASVNRVEAERSVLTSNVDSMLEKGLFALFSPTRFGGANLDWSALYALGAEIAKGCASTSWIYYISSVSSWILQRFPETAQRSVWGQDASAVLACTMAGKAVATESREGFCVTGRWRFASGVNHSAWAILAADAGPSARSDSVSREAQTRLFLIPSCDYKVIETWYSEGLKGTGSNDIETTEIFVPHDRTISIEEGMWHRSTSEKRSETSITSTEIQIYQMAGMLGPLIGTAQRAFDDYLEYISNRKDGIFGELAAKQPTVQLRIGESSAQLYTAELLANDLIQKLAQYSESLNQPIGIARSEIKRNLAFIARMCVEGIDRLAGTMGATGHNGNNPVLRELRDLRTIAAHANFQWDRMMINDGKLRLGIETGDQLLDRHLKTDACDRVMVD